MYVFKESVYFIDTIYHDKQINPPSAVVCATERAVEKGAQPDPQAV